jgi:hypothetical protein
LTVTDQLATKVFIDTLDGEKLFKFRKLNAYDNQRVYFTTVQQLLMSIAGLATNKDGKPVKNLSDVDISRFATILQQIDFDVFHDDDWAKGMVTVKSLSDCDYFSEFPEELYLATFHALQVNYPKSFGRLKEKLGAFGQKARAAMESQLATVSTEQPLPSEV